MSLRSAMAQGGKYGNLPNKPAKVTRPSDFVFPPETKSVRDQSGLLPKPERKVM